jgi:hypothetical protein
MCIACVCDKRLLTAGEDIVKSFSVNIVKEEYEVYLIPCYDIFAIGELYTFPESTY